ncbi:hypothetical protein MXB_5609 [Myxobolus squamalis]|nr:hypothetical protein MXB_5609 [Myxobolus squamalis]
MVLDHLVIQTMDNRFSSVMFNKEELTLILKFGAEELFKENIEEDGKEPLQELDLDDIMKLSEPTDTDGLHQLSRGEEFLSSFKVANFKSLEIDENLYKDSIRWKDIIPQSEVLKINNENFVKKQAELYLPPRRTIKQVSEKQANTLIDSLDENSADDDEKNKLTIDSLNKRSLRQFIREYQKFSYASTRLELVLKSAETLSEIMAQLK